MTSIKNTPSCSLDPCFSRIIFYNCFIASAFKWWAVNTVGVNINIFCHFIKLSLAFDLYLPFFFSWHVYYLLWQQRISGRMWNSSEHTYILVTCEELWPSSSSQASIKKHASWLIIITTSECFLVQLGQTSWQMLAAFFLFLDIKPSVAAKCDEQTVNQTVSLCVLFSDAFLSGKMNFLWYKNTKNVFTFF